MKATKGVVAQAESMRRSRDAKESRDREASQAIAAKLGSQTIEVKARARARAASSSARSPPPTSPTRCRPRPASSSTAARSSLDEPIRELGDAQVQVRLPAEVVVAVAVLVVAE